MPIKILKSLLLVLIIFVIGLIGQYFFSNLVNQKIRDLILNNQSQDLCELHQENFVNDFQQIQIDNTLVRLCDSMGRAERIKNTAFPKTYRLTLHLFIYIFLITLSFSLAEMPNLMEIPLMILISIPFFLIEKIAFNIQDPFENKPTDIPMTSISRTIEIDIKQQLGVKDIPEPIATDKFYVL